MRSFPRSEHAIEIFPHATGLPIATGLSKFQQTKHWKTGLATTVEFLELISHDETAGASMESNETTLAALSKHEISGARNKFARYFMYFWPSSDEEKMALLAFILVPTFIGDGM
jgi:hypothetical protein